MSNPDRGPTSAPSSVSIRYADQDDLADLAAVARKIWHAHYPGIISEGQIEYMLERGYALSVLEAELSSGIAFPLIHRAGQLIGFASFGPTEEPGEAKLHKLYLDPAHHGQGLGKRLLSWTESEAANHGFTRITLQVNKQNTKAVNAYSRGGYEMAREAAVDIGQGYVMDDFIMEKTIDPTSEANS